MKGWKKTIFGIALFLIAPWLLLILASQLATLFLSPSGESVVTSLETLRNWNGLKVIGLIFSITILLYGKELSTWYINTKMVKPQDITQDEFTAASNKAVDMLYWLLWSVVSLNLIYILFF